MSKIPDLIRKIVGENLHDDIVCKVQSVSGQTCTVVDVLDNAIYENVRLTANVQSANGFILKPAKDSYVIISQITENDRYVSFFSEIDGLEFVAENQIIFNNGTQGLVKIIELTTKLNQLITELNTLKTWVNTHVHAVSGSATLVPTAPFTGPISSFVKTDYESEKIKH